MRDTLYHFFVGALDLLLWGGELEGEENLPQKGPAVFIANHLGATGPIACHCSIPVRLYPWSIGDMMDRDRAAEYINWDFTERVLHLKPPISLFLSRLLVRITVPMFWSLGCIPVYKGDYESMLDTLRLSMDVLRKGKFLLIFPEEPSMEADPWTGMKPFLHTFARLGELYHEETGERLAYHPLAIHPKGKIKAGKAVLHDPHNRPALERKRLNSVMEADIRDMYLQMQDPGAESGVLTPERK